MSPSPRNPDRPQDAADRTYLPVAAQIIGGLDDWSTVCRVLAEPQPRRGFAISEGFTAYECDDFNIAVIEHGRIVSWDWMDEVVDDDPDVLARIMRDLGMQP